MKIYLLIILLSLFSVAVNAYDDNSVIEESNFQNLSVEMKSRKMGLVLMLHAEYCRYCKIIDEKVLSPMENSGKYKQRVFIRKLLVDKAEFITDFKGNRVAVSQFSNKYDSQMTPTIVFLDSSGNENAVKLIGIESLDYFVASLDEQIHELIDSLRE